MNAATFDLYFHDRDIDYGHGHKENFKDIFCHQKWHNNVKKEKGECENIDKKMKVYIIITVVKIKDHLSCTDYTPKHLTNNEKNIETHFAYEDSDYDYGHMDVTHLDIIIIFFAKANESIDHLIDYESVKKNLILIFTFI